MSNGTTAGRGWRPTARRRLVGARSGWAVGVLGGTALGAGLLAANVSDLQPFPLWSVGYWLVVAVYALPAVLGTIAGGGLLPVWLAEGLVGGSFAWLVTDTPPDADYIVYTSIVGRLWDVFMLAALFAVLFGTGGYLVGRLLLAVAPRVADALARPDN